MGLQYKIYITPDFGYHIDRSSYLVLAAIKNFMALKNQPDDRLSEVKAPESDASESDVVCNKNQQD